MGLDVNGEADDIEELPAGPITTQELLPARKGADLDLPALRRFEVTNHPQVGEGFQLCKELVEGQGVKRRFPSG